jgi:hypothetical protein
MQYNKMFNLNQLINFQKCCGEILLKNFSEKALWQVNGFVLRRIFIAARLEHFSK